MLKVALRNARLAPTADVSCSNVIEHQTILMPVSARRQLNDLADDMWTKVNIEFYRDVPDAVFKASHF
jgi:predicted ATP-dependent Lon-type protease